MVAWDDEKLYSDRNFFTQIRTRLINALKGNTLKKASDGSWETAEIGTEYYSPNQQGGIYGTVYRQYFAASLPSSLTSGSNVTGMIDYLIQLKYTTSSRGLGHGNATAYGSSDNHIYIMLSGTTGAGNLSLNKDGYTSQKGWVDYTK